MNKVVTIHLCGVAFQLEEAGYDALRAYLDGAARRLEGNPDKDEIIADIEQAIADKCRVVLGAYKNVILTQEIERIIEEMGPVQDPETEGGEPRSADGTAAGGSGPTGPAAGAGVPPPPPRPRRLYKIHDGAMFAGVCNGLGIYFGIDPTLVRLLFVVLTFLWGFAILVYLVLMFILPSPETPAERAAAFGVAATAQEFVRRAREGCYEGMRTVGDRRAHREWRRRFKRDMRAWGRQFKHEMRAGAFRWQDYWQQHWTPSPSRPGVPPPPGLLVLMPVFALLRAALLVVGFLALVSLLTTHAVFGLAIPAGMPLWVALILLAVVYSIVAWPLKAIRHAWHWHATPGAAYGPPRFWFGETIIGLGCLVVLLWFVDRHVPQAHEALHALPAVLHHALETVRQWWSTG